MKIVQCLIVACLFASSVGIKAEELLITDVNLIDVKTGEVSVKDIAIDNGSIKQIGDDLPRKGIRVINGRGKYAIPGLWDSHAHIQHMEEDNFPIFIYYGITGLRDMGGDAKKEAALVKGLSEHGVVSPHIERSSPIFESDSWLKTIAEIDMSDEFLRKRIGVGSPDQVEQHFTKMNKFDFGTVKIRTSKDSATYLAIVKAAKKLGFQVATHIPFQNNRLVDAIEAGVDSFEHSIFVELANKPVEQRNEIYNKMAQHGTYLSPTIVTMQKGRQLTYQQKKQQLASPHYKDVIAPDILETWGRNVFQYFSESPINWRKMTNQHFQFLKEAYNKGVKFLAATDMPGTFLEPGKSLHQELVNLVDIVGLTTLEALQAATINAADVTNQGDRFGSIEVGKDADILLLNHNPLEDIRNTQNIAAVIKSGKVFADGQRQKLYDETVDYVHHSHEHHEHTQAPSQVHRVKTIKQTLSALTGLKDASTASIPNLVNKLIALDSYGEVEFAKLNDLAYMLLWSGFVGEAELVFNQSATVFTRNLEACDSRAEFYFRIDYYTKATELYRECMNKNAQENESEVRKYQMAQYMIEQMKL